jgi:hypothetical protein
LVGEADRVERSEEEVPGLVAREDPAGAVPAVRGRSEADDPETRPRISERRERPTPVDLAPEAPWRATCGLLPPRDQARTAPAADDLVFEAAEFGGDVLQRRE